MSATKKRGVGSRISVVKGGSNSSGSGRPGKLVADSVEETSRQAENSSSKTGENATDLGKTVRKKGRPRKHPLSDGSTSTPKSQLASSSSAQQQNATAGAAPGPPSSAGAKKRGRKGKNPELNASEGKKNINKRAMELEDTSKKALEKLQQQKIKSTKLLAATKKKKIGKVYAEKVGIGKVKKVNTVGGKGATKKAAKELQSSSKVKLKSSPSSQKDPKGSKTKKQSQNQETDNSEGSKTPKSKKIGHSKDSSETGLKKMKVKKLVKIKKSVSGQPGQKRKIAQVGSEDLKKTKTKKLVQGATAAVPKRKYTKKSENSESESKTQLVIKKKPSPMKGSKKVVQKAAGLSTNSKVQKLKKTLSEKIKIKSCKDTEETVGKKKKAESSDAKRSVVKKTYSKSSTLRPDAATIRESDTLGKVSKSDRALGDKSTKKIRVKNEDTDTLHMTGSEKSSVPDVTERKLLHGFQLEISEDSVNSEVDFDDIGDSEKVDIQFTLKKPRLPNSVSREGLFTDIVDSEDVNTQSTLDTEDIDSEDINTQSTVDSEDVNTQSTLDSERATTPCTVDSEMVNTPQTVDSDQLNTSCTGDSDQVNTPCTVDSEDVNTQSTLDSEQVNTPCTEDSEDVVRLLSVDSEEVNTPDSIDSNRVNTPYSVETERMNTPCSVLSEHVNTPSSVLSEHINTSCSVDSMEVTMLSSVDSEHGVTGSVDSEHGVTGSVDSEHGVTGSVDSEHGVTGSVDSEHGVTGSVDSEQGVTGSVDSEQGVTGSVDGEQGVTGSVDGEQGVTGSVDGEQGVTGSVDGEQGVTGSVDGEQGVTGSVDGEQGVTGSVDGEQGVTGSVDGEQGVTGSVDGEQGVTGSVDGEQGVTGSVDGEQGVTGSVDGEQGVTGSVDGEQGFTGSVDGEQGFTGSVDGEQGVTGSVDGEQGVTGSVDGEQGVTGSVDGEQGVTGSVDGEQGVTGSVDGEQGVTGSVDGEQGVTGSVDGEQGVTGSVDGEQGVTGSVDGEQGVTGSVDEQGVTGSVDGEQGVTGSVDGEQGVTGSVDGEQGVTGSVETKEASCQSYTNSEPAPVDPKVMSVHSSTNLKCKATDSTDTLLTMELPKIKEGTQVAEISLLTNISTQESSQPNLSSATLSSQPEQLATTGRPSYPGNLDSCENEVNQTDYKLIFSQSEEGTSLNADPCEEEAIDESYDQLEMSPLVLELSPEKCEKDTEEDDTEDHLAESLSTFETKQDLSEKNTCSEGTIQHPTDSLEKSQAGPDEISTKLGLENVKEKLESNSSLEHLKDTNSSSFSANSSVTAAPDAAMPLNSTNQTMLNVPTPASVKNSITGLSSDLKSPTSLSTETIKSELPRDVSKDFISVSKNTISDSKNLEFMPKLNKTYSKTDGAKEAKISPTGLPSLTAFSRPSIISSNISVESTSVAESVSLSSKPQEKAADFIEQQHTKPPLLSQLTASLLTSVANIRNVGFKKTPQTQSNIKDKNIFASFSELDSELSEKPTSVIKMVPKAEITVSDTMACDLLPSTCRAPSSSSLMKALSSSSAFKHPGSRFASAELHQATSKSHTSALNIAITTESSAIPSGQPKTVTSETTFRSTMQTSTSSLLLGGSQNFLKAKDTPEERLVLDKPISLGSKEKLLSPEKLTSLPKSHLQEDSVETLSSRNYAKFAEGLLKMGNVFKNSSFYNQSANETFPVETLTKSLLATTTKITPSVEPLCFPETVKTVIPKPVVSFPIRFDSVSEKAATGKGLEEGFELEQTTLEKHASLGDSPGEPEFTVTIAHISDLVSKQDTLVDSVTTASNKLADVTSAESRKEKNVQNKIEEAVKSSAVLESQNMNLAESCVDSPKTLLKTVAAVSPVSKNVLDLDVVVTASEMDWKEMETGSGLSLVRSIPKTDQAANEMESGTISSPTVTKEIKTVSMVSSTPSSSSPSSSSLIITEKSNDSLSKITTAKSITATREVGTERSSCGEPFPEESVRASVFSYGLADGESHRKDGESRVAETSEAKDIAQHPSYIFPSHSSSPSVSSSSLLPPPSPLSSSSSLSLSSSTSLSHENLSTSSLSLLSSQVEKVQPQLRTKELSGSSSVECDLSQCDATSEDKEESVAEQETPIPKNTVSLVQLKTDTDNKDVPMIQEHDNRTVATSGSNSATISSSSNSSSSNNSSSSSSSSSTATLAATTASLTTTSALTKSNDEASTVCSMVPSDITPKNAVVPTPKDTPGALMQNPTDGTGIAAASEEDTKAIASILAPSSETNDSSSISETADNKLESPTSETPPSESPSGSSQPSLPKSMIISSVATKKILSLATLAGKVNQRNMEANKALVGTITSNVKTSDSVPENIISSALPLELSKDRLISSETTLDLRKDKVPFSGITLDLCKDTFFSSGTTLDLSKDKVLLSGITLDLDTDKAISSINTLDSTKDSIPAVLTLVSCKDKVISSVATKGSAEDKVIPSVTTLDLIKNRASSDNTSSDSQQVTSIMNIALGASKTDAVSQATTLDLSTDKGTTSISVDSQKDSVIPSVTTLDLSKDGELSSLVTVKATDAVDTSLTSDLDSNKEKTTPHITTAAANDSEAGSEPSDPQILGSNPQLPDVELSPKENKQEEEESKSTDLSISIEPPPTPYPPIYVSPKTSHDEKDLNLASKGAENKPSSIETSNPTSPKDQSSEVKEKLKPSFAIFDSCFVCVICRKMCKSKRTFQAHVWWHFHACSRMCTHCLLPPDPSGNNNQQKQQLNKCPYVMDVMLKICRTLKKIRRATLQSDADMVEREKTFAEDETDTESVDLDYDLNNGGSGGGGDSFSSKTTDHSLTSTADDSQLNKENKSYTDATDDNSIFAPANVDYLRALYSSSSNSKKRTKKSSSSSGPNHHHHHHHHHHSSSSSSSSSTSSSMINSSMLSSHKKGGFYVCGFQYCSYSCMNCLQFRLHLQQCHNFETIFPCYHCGQMNYSKDDLIKHMYNHSNARDFLLFRCSFPRCRFGTNMLQEFHEHNNIFHVGELVFTCFYCSTEFSELSELLNHLQSNLLKFVQCPHCTVKDRNRRTVLNHISTEHPLKPKQIVVTSQVVCKKKQTISPDANEMHHQQLKLSRSMSEDRILECIKCGLLCRNIATLRKHSRVCLRDALSKKTFMSPRENHLTMIYSCQWCSFPAASDTMLFQHTVDQHPGKNANFERIEQKTLGSGFGGFDDLSRMSLSSSWLEAAKMEAIICPYCKVGFDDELHWSEHMEREHNDEEHTVRDESGYFKYPCDFCEFNGISEQDLVEHQHLMTVTEGPDGLHRRVVDLANITPKVTMLSDTKLTVSNVQSFKKFKKSPSKKMNNAFFKCSGCHFRSLSKWQSLRHVKHCSLAKRRLTDYMKKRSSLVDQDEEDKIDLDVYNFPESNSTSTASSSSDRLKYDANNDEMRNLKSARMMSYMRDKQMNLMAKEGIIDCTDTEGYKCSICKHTGKTMINIRQHLWKTHLKLKPVRCPSCPFTSWKNYTLEKHKISKHKHSHPSLSDQEMKTLAQHLQGTTEGIIECQLCFYKSPSPYKVRTHIWRTHMHVEMKQCRSCSYKCWYWYLMNMHQLSRHKAKADQGSTKNDQKDSDSSGNKASKTNLNNSIEILTNDTIMADEDMSLLAKELMEKKSGNKIECCICKYQCTRIMIMKIHIWKRHLNVKQRKCPDCPYICWLQTRLDQHVCRIGIPGSCAGISDDVCGGGGATGPIKEPKSRWVISKSDEHGCKLYINKSKRPQKRLSFEDPGRPCPKKFRSLSDGGAAAGSGGKGCGADGVTKLEGTTSTTSTTAMTNLAKGSKNFSWIRQQRECSVSQSFFRVSDKKLFARTTDRMNQIEIYTCVFCSYKSWNMEAMCHHTYKHKLKCGYCLFRAYRRKKIAEHIEEFHQAPIKLVSEVNFKKYRMVFPSLSANRDKFRGKGLSDPYRHRRASGGTRNLVINLDDTEDSDSDSESTSDWRPSSESEEDDYITRYCCCYCSMRTHDYERFRKHIVKHSRGSEELHCQSCSYRTRDSYKFEHHLKKHPNEHFCGYCNFSSMQESFVQLHVRRVHPQKPVQIHARSKAGAASNRTLSSAVVPADFNVRVVLKDFLSLDTQEFDSLIKGNLIHSIDLENIVLEEDKLLSVL